MQKKVCSRVQGVGFFVPEKVMSNDDLAQIMDTSDAWITERTGIKQRRFVDVNTSTSDLGVQAAKNVLMKTGTQAKDVDLIIAGTVTPDHYFPGIGVQIQAGLGVSGFPAIDIRGQCSVFAWGVATADAYIRSGFCRRALVIGAETQSRVMELSDRGRNFSVLFGDAGGAILLEAHTYDEGRPTVQNGMRGLIDHMMGSDGSGAEMLSLKRPGFAKEHKEFLSLEEAADRVLPNMDGRQVFRNAVERMSELADKILTRNKITAKDISLLIPHQANLRINEFLREKLGLAPEKVFNNIQRYGNTSAATLPLCMSEAEQFGHLKKGDLLLTLTFGSGYTWGANLIRW